MNKQATDVGTVIELKAALLAEGMRPTKNFIEKYGPPFLEKRRAYGNPDALEFRGIVLPQELYLLPERLICSINIRQSSIWVLDWTEDQGFVVHPSDTERGFPITFPERPAFYDMALDDGRAVNSIITLYGGGSLGVFVYGNCALVDMNKACQYCPISPNRSKVNEFAFVVDEATLTLALRKALTDQRAPIKQVMLNGGNFRDVDKSFSYYAKLVAAARRVLDDEKRDDIELHLIVFPPRDLSLIKELDGLGVDVAMNCEVHDPDLFAKYCPGKEAIGGQKALLTGLEKAVEVLGAGHVYSIFVGGLEPEASLRKGMDRAAALGATPVINVFHADPETPLSNHRVASQKEIMAMGASLQEVYQAHSFARPFYTDCGRNSLDTEAYRGLF